jgi:hypothetical protein
MRRELQVGVNGMQQIKVRKSKTQRSESRRPNDLDLRTPSGRVLPY